VSAMYRPEGQIAQSSGESWRAGESAASEMYFRPGTQRKLRIRASYSTTQLHMGRRKQNKLLWRANAPTNMCTNLVLSVAYFPWGQAVQVAEVEAEYSSGQLHSWCRLTRRRERSLWCRRGSCRRKCGRRELFFRRRCACPRDTGSSRRLSRGGQARRRGRIGTFQTDRPYKRERWSPSTRQRSKACSCRFGSREVRRWSRQRREVWIGWHRRIRVGTSSEL